MIITIDGPAGSGKSTVADILSEKLGFIHFNSGNLYRGIVVHLLETGYDFKKLKETTKLPDFSLATKFVKGKQQVYVNGINYTNRLRENIVSTLAPVVSKNKFCRQKIDDCQRHFGYSHNSVFEGRDTGSFVFPDADFKFYLDCCITERSKRRFLEEKSKGNLISLKEIKEEIKLRDLTDKTKKIAPLVIPNGAIKINSSNLTPNEVANIMIKHINEN